MKKTYQRLPDSELDIMLVLWNNTPPMTRPEIDETGKNESVYTHGFAVRLSGT